MVEILNPLEYNAGKDELSGIYRRWPSMTRLAKFLRMLRVANGEVLFNMAKKLGVSSSFLSAVENEKKSPPGEWLDKIAGLYQLPPNQYEELREAFNSALKQVRISVTEVDQDKREMAFVFARRFESLDDEEVKRVMQILGKKTTE